jgi:hypothetical protein
MDLVEAGLVEQALAFIHRNTRRGARIEGGKRIEIPDYPEDVLREAIVMSAVDSKPASYGRIKTSHFLRLNRGKMFWQVAIEVWAD